MVARRLLTALALSGCTLVAQSSSISVGLLGGESIRTLATRLETSPPGAIRTSQGIEAVGKTKPKIVLFVVNAPDGPMPPNREALEFMAKAGITNFAIVFTGTTDIHDPELFGLIIAEVVDLVNKAGLPGDRAPIFLDSDSVRTDPKLKVRKGIKALQDYIGKN